MNALDVIKEYKEYVAQTKPLLTIFITSSHRVDLLKIMIESVVKQNHNKYPVFILDNNSNDGTKEMVESFTDCNIFFLERESVAVDDSNYTYAFSICKTDYLAVLHDDDYLGDLYLEKMSSFIRDHCDATVVSCCEIHIDFKGNIIEHDKHIKPDDKSFESFSRYENGDYFRKIIRRSTSGDPIIFPTAIYKLSFFDDIKSFIKKEAGPARDLYIWFEIERRGGVLYVLHDKLYYYRIHQGQDSYVNAGIMEKRFLEFLLEDDNYFKHKYFTDDNVRYYLMATLKALMLNYKRNKNMRPIIKESLSIDKKVYQLGKRCKRMKKYYLFCRLVPHFASTIMYCLDFFYQMKKAK